MSKVLDMLREQEGTVHHAYQDHLGYWTIGVGRLIDQRKGGGLSDDEIDYLLQNDVRRTTEALRAALPWFDQLNEPREAALVSMAFQMGVNGLLGFKNTLAAVRDGRWADAKKGMLDSLWARQTPARAQRVAEQMATGEWQY